MMLFLEKRIGSEVIVKMKIRYMIEMIVDIEDQLRKQLLLNICGKNKKYIILCLFYFIFVKISFREFNI